MLCAGAISSPSVGHADQPKTEKRDEAPSASPQPSGGVAAQDITIVARPQERGSIDRLTYVVKDNAEARSSSALDLLGRVPAVDVSPSGAVRFMGRSGVVIQVDGQDVPNAGAFLRAMGGSQVAKIELVTNPSAQFSSRGTGGLINVITRRSAGTGLGGSAMAKAGTLGGHELRSSPSWTIGKWSLGGSIGERREGSKSETDEERSSGPAGERTGRIETERNRGHSDQLTASLQAAVDIAPRATLSLDGMGFATEGERTGDTAIVEDDVRSQQRTSVATDILMWRLGTAYRREGSRPGSLASLSASHSEFRFLTGRRFATEAAGLPRTSAIRSRQSGRNSLAKADLVRPVGDSRLSVGGQYERSVEGHRQGVRSSPSPSGPIASDERFDGSWSEAAAYASYQFPVGPNNVLAGVRVESRRHDIRGSPAEPQWKKHIFPSLHIERTLTPRLSANLSYSSRIGWPSLAHLDPALRFSDPVTARAGNPRLRPEKTHSLELKLAATRGGHAADLTASLQRTRDLRSETSVLEGEVLISRPANVGTRTSLGASLLLRGPLARGLRYTATASLVRERIGGAALPGVAERSAGYGASLQLDYRDGAEGRAGADQLRLAARWAGPSDTGLSRISSTLSAEASWSHALTDRLAAVLTASHMPETRTVTRGPDLVARSTFRASGPTVSIALTYGLGSPGR